MNMNNRAIDEAALMASALHSQKTSWRSLLGFGQSKDHLEDQKAEKKSDA